MYNMYTHLWQWICLSIWNYQYWKYNFPVSCNKLFWYKRSMIWVHICWIDVILLYVQATRVRARTRVHTRKHTRKQTHTHTHPHTHTHTHPFKLGDKMKTTDLNTHTHTRTHARAHTHTHRHTRTHVRTKHICVCTRAHTHITGREKARERRTDLSQ